MSQPQTYTSRDLTLNVRHDGESIEVLWLGKSTSRDPATFLSPILAEALRKAAEVGKAIVMDFQKLEYMNSSTITPVIRILHEAKKNGGRVQVVYVKSLKWQELSFSALTIFQTDDGRIQIRGV